MTAAGAAAAAAAAAAGRAQQHLAAHHTQLAAHGTQQADKRRRVTVERGHISIALPQQLQTTQQLPAGSRTLAKAG
jgi:hypothetical protein